MKQDKFTEGSFDYTVENGHATIVGIADNVACVSIPETLDVYSVSSIVEGVFSGLQTITEVIIPNSVTRIEDGSFFCCRALRKITLPASITHIGEGAFFCCTSLSEVTIPNSVTSIGMEAFDKGCLIICNEGSAAHEYASKNSNKSIRTLKDKV